jgi:hypothetical protein
MAKKLIELFEDTRLTIVEDKKESGLMRAKVMWQKAGVVNRNGRFYPKKLLQREIERLNEKAKQKELFGFSFHPKTASGDDITDISFRIDRLWMEEDGSCFGEISILPTSKGKDLGEVLRHGTVGASSRGTGSTKLEKIKLNGKEVTAEVVQDDYRLIAFDLVLGQSVPEAKVLAVYEKASVFRENEEDDFDSLVKFYEEELELISKLHDAYSKAGIDTRKFCPAEVDFLIDNLGAEDEKIEGEEEEKMDEIHTSKLYKWREELRNRGKEAKENAIDSDLLKKIDFVSGKKREFQKPKPRTSPLKVDGDFVKAMKFAGIRMVLAKDRDRETDDGGEKDGKKS